MKKQLLIITIIICSVFLITGCNKEKTSTNSSTSSTDEVTTTSTALCSNNGVDVNNVAVVLVGSTFNFQVTFANNNDEERTFDMTKFEIKNGNTTLKVNGSDSKTIEANKPYAQWTFTMSDTGDLKVGDTVKVYYDNELIKTLKVENF